MSDDSIRQRSPGDDDIPGIVALFEQAFGRAMSRAHYRWKLRDRPSPVDNAIIAVDASQRPVFHIGGLPRRCQLDGGARWVMVAVDAMTALPMRRHGLLTTYGGELFSRWRAAGVAFILGMPNRNHGSRIAALGWRPLTSLAWLLLPVRPGRMLGRWLGLPASFTRARGEGGSPWKLARWRMGAIERAGGNGLDVREVDALGANFDDFWRRASFDGEVDVVDGGGACLARDHAWMTWRYLNDPERRYRILVATRGADIVGTMACGVADPRTITVAEFFTLPGEPAALGALLRAAIHGYGAEAESVRTLAVPGSATHHQLRRAGFLRWRHSFRIDYIPLDPGLQTRALAPSTAWRLAGGDFDVV